MIEALGTLPFLATLWLLVVLGAAVLEESGGKIAAALKGDVAPAAAAVIPHRRAVRRLHQSAPARPQWRAAA